MVRSSLGIVLAVLWLGCASSRPSGNAVDATADGTGGDGAVGDGAEPDGAGLDGAGPDGAGPDAAALDGAGPDGASLDAMADAAIDANTCSTQPCSLYPQCGCTAPLTCDIDFTDLMGTACRAVNAPGMEGSTCGSFSECAAGYVCAGGRCHRYCDTDASCPQPRGMCAIQITDQGGAPIAGAVTCSANCNPAQSAAGGCPAGQKCGFFTVMRGTPPASVDIVDCATPGAGAHGAACTTDATCAADTLCSTVNAAQRCRRVCTRPAGNECAAVPGTTCVGFNPALTVGGTEYGVCGP
ncbi:MAG: hypothetical protein R3B06_15045 [Kofleriaceae bacterium]